MRQVRQGCFETNSSSAHCLIIKKDNDYETVEELEEDMFIHRIGRDEWTTEKNANRINLCIWDKDEDLRFERFPFQVLTSSRDKLRYYIASECKTEEDIRKVEDTLRNMFDDIQEIKFCDDENWGDGDYDQYGYAQNYGSFKTALKQYNIDLKEFLTNRKYVVIVDGDEYNEFYKMQKSGLINSDNIEEIFNLY